MTKIDLIAFDFDGTLVQSGQDLVDAVNHTLQILNVPTLDTYTVKRFIGDGVKKLIERSLGDAGERDSEKAREIFLAYYEAHLLDTTVLYPGVKDILNYFKAIHKIILTNKMEYLTLKIARGLGIEGYFEEIVGIDSRSYTKPDRRLLMPYLKRSLQVGGRAVVIGDGVNDIMLAKNAGVLSCALLNGLTDRNELLNLSPHYCCENIEELQHLFY